MSVPETRSVNGGAPPPTPDSKWRVWSDLAWAHVLVWFATGGRGVRGTQRTRRVFVCSWLPGFDLYADQSVRLRQGVHVYFADCYLRLAAIYEREGSLVRVGAVRAKAGWHLEAAGPLPGDPPPAAAAVAGIPRQPELVDARGQIAPSVRSPFPPRLTPAGAPTS